MHAHLSFFLNTLVIIGYFKIFLFIYFFDKICVKKKKIIINNVQNFLESPSLAHFIEVTLIVDF